jgi:peroxiredoxin Q/BCP
MGKLTPGEKAPDFSLPDQDGKSVSLAQFLGKKVIVYFYPKDDTPGCTKEACQFNGLLNEFAHLDIDVLGISSDSAASHRQFREKHDLKLCLVSDVGHVVMERFGAWGEKTSYGKVSVGVIRSTFVVGKDGRIERAMYNVKADGHAAKILADITG